MTQSPSHVTAHCPISYITSPALTRPLPAQLCRRTPPARRPVRPGPVVALLHVLAATDLTRCAVCLSVCLWSSCYTFTTCLLTHILPESLSLSLSLSLSGFSPSSFSQLTWFISHSFAVDNSHVGLHTYITYIHTCTYIATFSRGGPLLLQFTDVKQLQLTQVYVKPRDARLESKPCRTRDKIQ